MNSMIDLSPAPLYHPKDDVRFAAPVIEREEWRDAPIRHLYVHGGFEGTHVRFSLYFPPKEAYTGRFFHLMTPVQGSEDASQTLTGEEDNISFSVSHGAYFVESNMGGNDPDFTMLFKSSAAVAEFSRSVAARLFGKHRPFGYVFGGSGGGFKTTGCVERTECIWDGSVPFVIGSPMAIPNMFTVRVHAMRLLRDKFPAVIDALEPGGSGDPYQTLDDEEKAALREATRFGFPPRTWFSHDQIGAGALPVLTYAIDQMDPTYYVDFWTKPGYLGADPDGSAVRDRFRHETRVSAILLPTGGSRSGELGVDNAWQTLAFQYDSDPAIQLEQDPGAVRYLDGTKLRFLSGDAAGISLPLGKLENGTATVGPAFGMGDVTELLRRVKPGDAILLDNSDYIALQTYHRHQLPDRLEYPAWDQFRDESGEPLYPQRSVLIGPITAFTGAGSLQSGRFHGKMICMASLMDESALPWQADWYRGKVREALGDGISDRFRLWFNDHAMHGGEYDANRSLHIVSYRPALNRALLDLSDWVERGIEPAPDTAYQVVDAQIEIPDSAAERGGIQPVVSLTANGRVRADVRVGDAVVFEGMVVVPPGTGKVALCEFDFEGEATFACRVAVEIPGALAMVSNDQSLVHVRAHHVFDRPGTFFPVLRAASSRDGGTEDAFVLIKNLARVRVVVSQVTQ